MKELREEKIEVSLFCGGRGASSIIKELVKYSNIKLNLFINGYDNGLSTGELRKFIPGMLGPSDFRKNLSHLLEIHSPNQYFVISLLEYRFPEGMSTKSISQVLRNFEEFKLIDGLKDIFGHLSDEYTELIRGYLERFSTYCEENGNDVILDGCSLGNIIFAGLYLELNRDFNSTLEEILVKLDSRINANLYNISKGENRFLVALKENGDFLYDEALIVEPQDQSAIVGIYLLESNPDKNFIEKINCAEMDQKRTILAAAHSAPQLSEQAKKILIKSDIILYGSGTHYSSTLPSYLTAGLFDALKESNAKAKVLVCNLTYDEDTYGYTLDRLVDTSLEALGDPENNHSLSHVLYDSMRCNAENGIQPGSIQGVDKYRGATILNGDFQHPVYPHKHCGNTTVEAILDAFYRSSWTRDREERLEIFVSLHNRSMGIPTLIDEFIGLKWLKSFGGVTLYVGGEVEFEGTLPEGLRIESVSTSDEFPEVSFFYEWIKNPQRSDFLLTLSGDGDYRFRDFYKAYHLLERHSVGAIFGTRVQSRFQFIHALSSAYTEHRILFWLSKIGGFLLSFLFALRSGVRVTDPITGFRAYGRGHIRRRVGEIEELTQAWQTPSALALDLLKKGVEIGEVPVSYRTYKGFTDPYWRIKRGLRNLRSLLGIF